MTSFYHGSTVRYLIENAGYRLRQWLKARRAPRSVDAADPVPPMLTEIDRLIGLRAWPQVKDAVQALTSIAEGHRDRPLMVRMAQSMERLGDYRGAADLRLAAYRLRNGHDDQEWDGGDIGAKTLLVRLVEDDPRSLGRVIRHAGLAGIAARSAGQATIEVEPRMVPLLRRTFPTAVVQAPGSAPSAERFATFEHLAAVYAGDAQGLASRFEPLLPDPAAVEEFKSRYRATTKLPLVGLSWGSKSHTKDVPGFEEWAAFLARTPATFVSLQYGQIAPALRRLRDGHDERLIFDDTVDQMVDVDRFAAQIAALDAVVTISNTAAHLAGALGVPTIFLIDDKFQTAWPVIGDRTPWYPNGIVIRKEGRGWTAVLDEAGERLLSILATPSATPATVATMLNA